MFQLVNIFGYIKNKNIYIHLSNIILNSKEEELYTHAFNKLIIAMKNHNNFDNYNDIKIMSDFEISLKKSLENFRLNTMILSFVLKAFPFVKEKRSEKYMNKIETFVPI